MSPIEIPIGRSSAPSALCLTILTRGAREPRAVFAADRPARRPATALMASSGSATRAVLRRLAISASIGGKPFSARWQWALPPGRLDIGGVLRGFKAKNPATGRNRATSDLGVGNFGNDHRGAPPDRQE